MQHVLITGCSSGFGLETARYFLARGWNVTATMRKPGDALPPAENLRVLALDVTDEGSIARVMAETGRVDVLVNNAGIGALGAAEAIPMAGVRALFETNTLGTIAMTQAVLPQMRERGAGVIVNVTSTVTLLPLPLLASYTASKAAVNAFTEAVAQEVAPFGIRLRLVLPGRAPQTQFGENARSGERFNVSEPYKPLADAFFARWSEPGPVTTAEAVAAAVWRAATEPASPMRILAGDDAVAMAA